MESIAYYDGKIGAPEELMVPFNDRVHFFGSLSIFLRNTHYMREELSTE